MKLSHPFFSFLPRSLIWSGLVWCAVAVHAASGSGAPQTPKNPGTDPTSAIPTALWIPLSVQGKDQGRWLLVSPDHRVLRDDLKSVFNYRVRQGRVVPTPAQALDGRWGYLDAQGQWAHPPVFEAARSFSDEDHLGRVQKDGLWGFIGGDLKVRIQPTWPEVLPFYHGYAAVRDKSKKWGVIDTSGALVVPHRYQRIGPFARNGMARALDASGQWSFIDGQGKTRVRLDKGMPLDFGNFDVVPVEVDERWGLMDAQGNWVLKPSLDDIDPFQDPGLAVFRRRYTPGYINLKGQEVIAPGDYGRVVRQGLIRAERRDHSFVDTSGKAAIAQRFGWVADFPTKGATVARKNGVWGLLNAQGEWVSAGPRREPWQVGPQRLQAIQGGLRVWSHAGQAIEWKNDAGQTVFRLTQGPGPAGKLPVLTLHAGDKTLWTSPPQRHPLDFTPTLEPQPEDLAALTGDALVAEAKRLLGAPARRFAPYSLVFHERRDAYDLNGLDEDEQENISLGGFTSLAQSYVSEEQWGSFEFLSDQRDEVFERIAAQSCQTLEAALGKSLPIPKGGERYWQGFTKRCMWQQGDRQLLLASFHETGDGEFEEQLALVVVAAP